MIPVKRYLYGMVTNPRLCRSKPEERREHILDVAADVFASEGYGATSMSSIAARLGGSKATLYKYFPSKEHLFEAMLGRKCERVLGPLREIVSRAEDLEKLLFEFGTSYLEALLQNDALQVFAMIQGDGIRFPEAARAFFKAGPDAVYREMGQIFATFADRGAIICPDPRLAAEQFLGMVRGDLHMRATLGLAPIPPRDEIERQVRFAAHVFARGLAPAPA